MEFEIKLNFSDLLMGDLENVLEFFQDVCLLLSSKTLVERTGVNDNFLGDEKENFIKKLSEDDYTLYLNFDFAHKLEYENSKTVSGFRVVASNQTADCIFFRSAMIFEIMGLDSLAHDMRVEFYTVILNDMLQDSIQESFQRNAVSKVNSKKASLPRHKYFQDVTEVIRLTWATYPGASQTGIHEALCSHYYGKVSRNALLKWITDSGFRPEKPKYFTAFELVFPPISQLV